MPKISPARLAASVALAAALLFQGAVTASAADPLPTPATDQQKALLNPNLIGGTVGSSNPGLVTPQTATGCTQVPTNLGSTMCFTVNGPWYGGKHIQNAVLDYATSGNICSRSFQIKYTPALGGQEKTLTTTKDGCAIGYTSTTWDLDKDMFSDTKICGRVKNSQTGNAWTEWLCHWIIA